LPHARRRTPARETRHGTRGVEPRGPWNDQEAEPENDLARELGDAAEVQACLLPRKIPEIPNYEVYPYYRSAKQVGGDYYDFFPVDQERLAIVIADVSGKGIPGAMVMASARALVRAFGPQCGSPAETLKMTNFHVARDVRRGMFVTAMLSVLNVGTREMTVCSAGHNPMVVYKHKTRQVGLLNPGGIALGFDRGPIFDRTLKESTILLEPGDRFVMYTDGVVEAMNADKEEFGEERFYKFVRDNAERPSREFVRALVWELDTHKGKAEQHDDITIITVRLLR
jgi:sigma-B regulation protein RsbU (phosphoserine phosphatase)